MRKEWLTDNYFLFTPKIGLQQNISNMDKSSIMDFRQVPTYACASFTYIRQVKNKRRVSDSKCIFGFVLENIFLIEEAYSEPYQTSKMERFAKIVNA